MTGRSMSSDDVVVAETTSQHEVATLYEARDGELWLREKADNGAVRRTHLESYYSSLIQRALSGIDVVLAGSLDPASGAHETIAVLASGVEVAAQSGNRGWVLLLDIDTDDPPVRLE